VDKPGGIREWRCYPQDPAHQQTNVDRMVQRGTVSSPTTITIVCELETRTQSTSEAIPWRFNLQPLIKRNSLAHLLSLSQVKTPFFGTLFPPKICVFHSE
jgi:hypothetical protein